jgi:hypothetical protein
MNNRVSSRIVGVVIVLDDVLAWGKNKKKQIITSEQITRKILCILPYQLDYHQKWSILEQI